MSTLDIRVARRLYSEAVVLMDAGFNMLGSGDDDAAWKIIERGVSKALMTGFAVGTDRFNSVPLVHGGET